MALETSVPRSRRALLAASLGALGAAVASAARPLTARATEGDTVHVGDELTGDSLTKLTVTDTVAFWGLSTNGIGVKGQSSSYYGVEGSSGTSYGVRASSGSNIGMMATSTTGVGAYGYSGAGGMPAIAGVSGGENTAVLGYSGTGLLPASPDKTGIYGYAIQDAASRGVWGRTTAGRGVYGQAQSGQGVRGYSSTGVGVYASTSDPLKGAAIRAVGRVRLDNCAGIATVASGQTSITVTPGIDIGPSSAIVATVMSNSSTTLFVRRVSTNTTSNTFTVHISGTAPAAGLRVAWHCFG